MAARYWVGGTANWDGTAGTKWALTSGGTGGQAIPGTGDDVFIDAKQAPNWAALTVTTLTTIRCPLAGTGNGYYYECTTAGTTGVTEPTWPTIVGNTVTDGTVVWTCRKATVTVSATANCLTLVFTNYIGTFTINNSITLSVYGTTITLGSGMTYTQGTTGVLSTASGTATAIAIAFNGITIPRLTLGKAALPSPTVTISGSSPTVQNLTIQGLASVIVTLAGVNLILTTSLIMATGNQVLTGLPFTITGTCTITNLGIISSGFNVSAGSTVVLGNILTVSGGTVTFPVGSFLSNPSNHFLSVGSGTTLNTAPVTWFGVSQQSTGTIFITSDLNIGAGGFVSNFVTCVISGAFSINNAGGVAGNPSQPITLTSATFNLNGVGANITASGFINGTININTGASYSFLGSAFSLNGCTFNLLGTATCSVPAVHTLTISSITLTTNNTATGANVVGGSEIQWVNINVNFTNTITYTTTVLGNLAGTNATTVLNTGKMLVYGNLSMVAGTFSGTSTIEFTGGVAATWGAGTYQNNIVVSKSGGAVVTAGAAITWGTTSRTLTMTTAVNFTTNSNTFTIPSSSTINNTIGSQFVNMTISNAVTLTLGGSTTTPITGTLLLSGSATFAGTIGWTCGTLSLTAAGTFTITLQNSITYTTTTSAQLTGGTNAARYTMTSNDGTIRAIWTLNNGASQSLVYVQGTRIDSSGGQTIFPFGLTPIDSPNWFLLTTPGTVAYTFVN